LKERLYARGIMIRSLRAPRLKEYVRITIGTTDENDALISELTEIERER
jgi:histidinol-phosphate/aromatic aminotransferase/cobyric acid decarboxylase-like protein